MRAWVFQDHRQKKKLGDKAPWSAGWIDPEGRKRSKRIGSKSRAEKHARKKEGELAAGLYKSECHKKWTGFVEEYERRILNGLEVGSKESALVALTHFARISGLGWVQTIKTQRIDDYVAERRKEQGLRKGDTVSPATINKELRHLKAALRVAHEWGYLPILPKVRMVREPKKLARFVTPEHFAAMYKACDVAKRPKADNYTPSDWWRALITFCYMTGWRISEPLAVRWDDVALDAAYAITRADDNKGDRDERVPLHPVVVEHLRKIMDFGSLVFFWPHHKRTLYVDFAAIQDAAGIYLPCTAKHEHVDTCHRYGFHDLRRAFATVNAPRLTADALQSLMRHKSYQTTQRYINMAGQLDEAVKVLHVPEVLKQQNEN